MHTKMFEEINEQPYVLDGLLKRYCGKVDILPCNKKFFLIGTGASYNACEAAKYSYYRYSSLLPHVLHTVQAINMPQELFKDSTTVLVSQSGRSLETKIMLDYLEDCDAHIIGITNDENSCLASRAHTLLPMYAGPEISSATKTYSATILLLYMLAGAGKEDLSKIPRLVEAALSVTEEKKEELSNIFLNCQNGYFTGIVPLDSAASQGALLFKEKCFLHIEGMSVNEFRHGTIESLTEGMPVVISTADNKQAEVHTHILKQLSARPVVFSSCDTDLDIPFLRLPGEIDIVLSHIHHTIPYQLLAENLSVKKGYNTDGFKYLSKVVDKF